jgi:cation transport regulator ChaB
MEGASQEIWDANEAHLHRIYLRQFNDAWEIIREEDGRRHAGEANG